MLGALMNSSHSSRRVNRKTLCAIVMMELEFLVFIVMQMFIIKFSFTISIRAQKTR